MKVWVSLSIPDHPLHERAERYWETEAAVERAFTRVTWLGLPRLLSDSRIFGHLAPHGRDAWRTLQEWMSMSQVVLLAEPPGLEEYLQHWISTIDIRAGDWTDAYLAAFATASGSRLVSFDAGFERYPGLSWLHLGP